MEGRLCPVIVDDDDESNNAAFPPFSSVQLLPTLVAALLLVWGADFTMVALDFCFVWILSISSSWTPKSQKILRQTFFPPFEFSLHLIAKSSSSAIQRSANFLHTITIHHDNDEIRQ
jgi:hypothetical protein